LSGDRNKWIRFFVCHAERTDHQDRRDHQGCGSKAASIIAGANAKPLAERIERAHYLLHLDRELTPERNLEYAACACERVRAFVQ